MSYPDRAVYILREPSRTVQERAELISLLDRISEERLLGHFAAAGQLTTAHAKEMLTRWRNAVEENQKYGGFEYRVADSLYEPQRSDFDGSVFQTDRNVAWLVARDLADRRENCPVQEIGPDDLSHESRPVVPRPPNDTAKKEGDRT